MIASATPSGPDFEAIDRAIREYEPLLACLASPGDDRLYDPDGTLYALALTGPCELSVYGRRRRIEAGDLAVIPAGLAIDVDPPGDFLALRHLGPPPFHFRERFLQVWSFEHVEAAWGSGPPLRDRIDPADPRHRLGFQVAESDASQPILLTAGPGPSLLVVLEGSWTMSTQGGEGAEGLMRLEPGGLAFIPVGQAVIAEGLGRLGIFRLKPEFEPTARVPSPSPEWAPR